MTKKTGKRSGKYGTRRVREGKGWGMGAARLSKAGEKG